MKKRLFIITIVASIFVLCILCNNNTYAAEAAYTYLSDIPYVEEKSFAEGTHNIKKDQNQDNGMITLNINNVSTPFIKGICAWATSEIVYDLSNYEYDYFTSYLGIDISEQSDYFNTGIKFYIYTSNDGVNWNEKYKSDYELYGWSEAVFVKIDIKNAKYLKLVADDNSSSWWAAWYDEAVYANAKLIKEDYEEDTTNLDFIKPLAYYDEIIKSNYNKVVSSITSTKSDNNEIDYELILLQREFVNNVGYDILQALAKYKDEYKQTIEWLMNDKETLRLYLVAGKPEGSYLNSIKVLSELYNNFKDDLENTNTTKYNTKYKDLYRNMILALSLTESGNVYFWLDGGTHSDELTRYQIYKNLHLQELIDNEVFEDLTVEEMRWVMNTIIDDEEIVWLNNYVRTKGEGKISPYNYIKYTFGYDYSLDKYYTSENHSKWNEKYNLSEYNITYEKGQPKLWIVFEEGSVCGGLSKTGSCIWGAYKGLPNTCISQPGHCAYIYYSKDSNGNGIWNLGNNVSGWGKSGKTEHLNTRTMNDWGTGSYTTGWNASYILLAQAAQNEYKKYEQAEEIMMLANVYSDDNTMLEKIYRKALEIEKLNFDAWLGLVNLYENINKTEEEYFELVKEIASAYTYYPQPMYDLLNLMKTKFTFPTYSTSFSLLLTNTLITATKATANESIQAQAVKEVANQLLGNEDTSIASFSFDGENAGKIVLSDRFKDTDVVWDYSIDGKTTWTQVTSHEILLTKEELAAITAEKDIRVHIVGVDYSEENIYIIDIQDSLELPIGLYANDLENELIGAQDYMLWKYNENDEWTSYSKKEPVLTGDRNLIVKAGATGLYLEGTETKTFKFTKDNQSDTNKYVSIKNISIESFSSEQAGSDKAINAIDGNINTIWHTKHDASDSERTIILKLENPIYLSSFEYVPRQSGTNGRAKNAILYVSTDGVKWTEVGSATNWTNDAKSKIITLKESVEIQYVKFVTTANWGDGRNFASAAMLNLYEDVTKKTIPTAEVEYDIIQTTQGPVTAKLVNSSTSITITNNNGSDTYVFNRNGTFTFEFVDKYGISGSVTATVDWIIEKEEIPEEDNGKNDNVDGEEKDDGKNDNVDNEEKDDSKNNNTGNSSQNFGNNSNTINNNSNNLTSNTDSNNGLIENIIDNAQQDENIENNVNESNKNNVVSEDTTVSASILPKTGTNDTIIIKSAMICLSIIAVASIIYIWKK